MAKFEVYLKDVSGPLFIDGDGISQPAATGELRISSKASGVVAVFASGHWIAYVRHEETVKSV